MELLFWSSLHWYAHLPVHHVIWITLHLHWILYCTQQCMDPPSHMHMDMDRMHAGCGGHSGHLEVHTKPSSMCQRGAG